VGGVAAFCVRLARGIQELGHSPCLIVGTPYGKRDEAGRKAYEQLVRNSAFPVVCLHLNVFHPKERPWRAADKISALGCQALVLSAHGPMAEAWSRLKGSMPIVGIAHNDDEYSYKEFQVCQQDCDAYVAVSSAIAQTLTSLNQQKHLSIRHIPYGVPLPAEVPDKMPSGPPRVLAVCRLEQAQKRVLDLARIWELYRRSGGTAALTICGSGPEEANLRCAFAADIERGAVNLPGAVSLDQMPTVYAQHDILLSVSAYEGLPISVLEAATHGLWPLLSKIRSGHQEIIEWLGEGRLCEIGNVDAFAAALLETTNQIEKVRQVRPEISRKARARFGIASMVTAHVQVVTDVLQQRAARISPSASPTPAMDRPKVDFLRRFLRKWQYSRHYGWQS
ncbi:MAG TPA: glycosyltransferase family 4 protein, partial [Clostridia bacterium]|nr:glycosyltransferase family 4 protein [Clostridia bacterium]